MREVPKPIYRLHWPRLPHNLRQHVLIIILNKDIIKMRLSPSVLLFVIIIFGCIQAPHKIMSPINDNELAPYLKKGTASIVGQAYRKLGWHDVKYGSGDTIYLMPVCAYTSEFILGVLSVKREETIDHRLIPYVRKTVVGSEGHFAFLKLPAGSYYVMTVINWEGASGYKGSLAVTSGVAYKLVSVSKGEHVKVIVTN